VSIISSPPPLTLDERRQQPPYRSRPRPLKPRRSIQPLGEAEMPVVRPEHVVDELVGHRDCPHPAYRPQRVVSQTLLTPGGEVDHHAPRHCTSLLVGSRRSSSHLTAALAASRGSMSSSCTCRTARYMSSSIAR